MCNSVARRCILDTADWPQLIIGRQFNFLGIKEDLLGFELVPVGGIEKKKKKQQKKSFFLSIYYSSFPHHRVKGRLRREKVLMSVTFE